ncbi:hypothetical protein MTOK_46260 [Mycolicibacterium tokaiense]|nr:hypothetical protein MTOK_46260 [Mycolicibacterium tokaiense]
MLAVSPRTTGTLHEIRNNWDELSRALAAAGFTEEWRIINRPDTVHQFPGLHLLAYRR